MGNEANYEIFNDTDYLLQYGLFGISDISLWLLVCLVSFRFRFHCTN
jgi:hypothetical protein